MFMSRLQWLKSQDLRTLRHDAGLSRSALAEKLGVEVEFVAKVEEDPIFVKTVELYFVEKWQKACCKSLTYILLSVLGRHMIFFEA